MQQDYKGYKIIIKWGAGFEILREYRGKFFELSGQNFHFNNIDQPLQRACNYIDNYPQQLEVRFKELFIKFCEDVSKDPMYYWEHFPSVDIKYYLKAHKKVKDGQ